MFKNVRLYFIIALVTRTNFDICRCWTLLGIARGISMLFGCLKANYDKEAASITRSSSLRFNYFDPMVTSSRKNGPLNL